MHIEDLLGIRVAILESRDLTSKRPWSGLDCDVARLNEPTADDIATGSSLGFIHKPDMLTWVARLSGSEDEFHENLPAHARQKAKKAVRRARRQVQSLGVDVSVQDPVAPEALDEFYAIYSKQVAGMKFGVPYGLRHRESILDGPESYFAVFARDNSRMVGGCLVRRDNDPHTVRIRFSAATSRAREAGLSRVLYLKAMQYARDALYTWVTLGDEPNLYGHLTKVGLFHFKAEMGFECVPSQAFGDATGHDQLDVVVRLDRLDDPVLVLEYASDGSALRPCLVTPSSESANLSRLDYSFLGTPRSLSPYDSTLKESSTRVQA